MKRLVLIMSAFLGFFLFSPESSGQITINETFDGTSTPTGWTYTSFARTTTSPCTGVGVLRRNFYSSAQTGNIQSPVQASNGQNLTISFNYKIINYTGGTATPNTPDWGDIYTEVSIDGGTTYTITAGTINEVNHVPSTSCAIVTYIVSGASVPNGNNVRIRIRGQWQAGDYYVYIDDFSATQPSTTPPLCATSPSPADAAINVALNAQLSWAPAAGATSYDVYFGTASNPPLVGNVATTTYNPGALSINTQYFWKIIPKNANGAADGCSEWSFTTLTPPSNDECINATSLPCGTSNLAGTTVNTVSESVSPGGCASLYGVWYTFTGDGQTTTISSVAGSGFDHEMDIFSGSCGALNTIICLDNGGSGGTETYTFTSAIGTNYFVYIAHYSTSSTSTGTFTISRTCTAPTPPSCTSIISPANNATNVAINGNITFSAASNATSYDVYLGTSNPPLSLLGNTITTSIAYLGLINNTTYYVQIVPKNAAGSASGCSITSFTTVPPPPPNDDCANATPFQVIPTDGTCVTLSNQSTLGATNSNVTPSGACTSNSGTPDDDVWFSFVAPATSVILEATFVSGNSDVYWHVFSSACASSMTAILCTDNNGGGTLTGLTIGNTYYIRLYTYSSGVSTVQNICLKTPPAPPSNDNCAGASQFPMIPTDGTCVTLSNQSTAGATNSNVTPTGACTSNSGTPDDDVWFSFVAPAASVILEATHVSGSTDVYWHVFSSSCGGTMTAILCTDTDAGGTLTGLTIGNTYFIRLYTWSSGVSTVKNICLKTPPPPPDCATLNTPIDGSTGVTLTTALTWTPAGTGGTPTSYKVYHGTANPPTTFSTVTAPTTTFTPSGRAYSTLYYWYIVPSNASGDASGCNTTIFSYTTEAPPPPPANNDPCDGTALTFGGSQTGTTVNATASSVPNQECDGFTNTSADVWYKIDNVDIFPGGTLTITIDPSASQDYAIYLYSYTDCSAPVFITCDDDGFGGENETILYTIPSFDGGNGSSNRDLTNYLVRVKQWSTASGTFSLSLAGTLPLELLDIKATVMPKYNLIEWSTASEKNTSHMVVERNDGSSLRWEEIGKTEAAGFSSDIRLYSFEDARPYQKAYYRVRSVDRDGLEQVSRKVFVDRTNVNGSPGLVNAYPLPVSKSLFVDLNLDNDQSTTFHLMTITGQSVMLLHRELKAGVQTIELDLSDLPSGVYLARISNPELSETVRIIKE